MSKKVTKTMKATKVTKSTKKAQPKKKVVAKKVANVKKNVATAKKAVAKVIKKQVAKRKVVAKKVAVKKATLAKTKGDLKVKPVAKKQTKKQAILEKITKMYSIVTQYSENLMQDVYSVVYRKKTLKRFINENLATNYINQEVLVRLGEHNIATAKKSRALNAELAAEFE